MPFPGLLVAVTMAGSIVRMLRFQGRWAKLTKSQTDGGIGFQPADSPVRLARYYRYARIHS